ncbi:thioesterase [Paenibacillus albidus]|uniref:Thioesterase n=1 Tax=Paenibacillus albidus TaxID=2041023 RepID=A0A917FXN3_9BACL|nr:thioesterase domain-containing protein [Paenibacillus albidus]GGG11625.1 thioesterase [Paenibacillus albidus]
MVSKVKLFCIPHAGGLSSIYYGWKDKLEDHIELIPIELPGRGTRANRPLCDNIQEVVLDLYREIRPYLDDSPFAIFGHSFGALLTYELIHLIKEASRREPLHVFFSGKLPLHIPVSRICHTLSRTEFEEYIIGLGGIPPELHNCTEILDLFLPIIRADIKLVETYQLKEDSIKPLPVDISILHGSEDQIADKKRLVEWTSYTSRQCHFHDFPGGHFFINDRTENVVNVVNRTLSRVC